MKILVVNEIWSDKMNGSCGGEEGESIQIFILREQITQWRDKS
jgi:hypothetical protein